MVLVLASRSPRRADLLTVAGIPFEVRPPGDVEANLAGSLVDLHGNPVAYARTLAQAKAWDVSRQNPGRLVLGADTVVVHEGDILEKPRDEEDASRLLTRLSGGRHTVVSAIALVGGPAGRTGTVAHQETGVEFLPVPAAAIQRYVDTGEPMDKAGAYGIQGYGALMVRSVQGCYFNVMGLPLARLGELLKEVMA
jgi:septum formation protein